MNEPNGRSIRRATARDAALLAEIGTRTFTQTFGADNTPEDMAAYLAYAFGDEIQRAELEDSALKAFLIEEAETCLGYAVLREGPPPDSVPGRRPIELLRIYVDRKYLGMGAGDALMSHCIEASIAADFHTLWLGVWERNTRAQAFYRRWKFERVGEHPFLLGGDLQTDWLMARPLP